MNRKLGIAIVVAMNIVGCATIHSERIVMVGPNAYVIENTVKTGKISDEKTILAMTNLAEEFCKGQGRQMRDTNSASRDEAIGAYASTEFQFRCVRGSAK